MTHDQVRLYMCDSDGSVKERERGRAISAGNECERGKKDREKKEQSESDEQEREREISHRECFHGKKQQQQQQHFHHVNQGKRMRSILSSWIKSKKPCQEPWHEMSQ